MSAVGSVIDSEALCRVGRRAGLDAVGVCSAEPFVDTRVELERRRDEGLHGGMAFTYRNPARSTEPARSLPNGAALIVGALSYADPPHPPERPAAEGPDAQDGPVGRVARYAWSDHYRRLRDALGEVAAVLDDAGWRARVLADDNALVDRAAAHRAGLGWYGKNANLLLPGRGSWFVLGSVLTDAPLEPTGGPVPDGCGSCTRCLDGCPTDAIVAPGVVDARRCLAWLVQAPDTFPHEFREALGDRIYGCDDCQEVCPPNRRVDRAASVSEPGRTETDTPIAIEAEVDLLGMLAASDDELLARHGRWYVARRDPAHLRRNALLALANTADPADPRVVAAVASALAHPEPVVRSHAVWAARRLGLDHLAAAVENDTDPMVVAERDAPPPTPRTTR